MSLFCQLSRRSPISRIYFGQSKSNVRLWTGNTQILMLASFHTNRDKFAVYGSKLLKRRNGVSSLYRQTQHRMDHIVQVVTSSQDASLSSTVACFGWHDVTQRCCSPVRPGVMLSLHRCPMLAVQRHLLSKLPPRVIHHMPNIRCFVSCSCPFNARYSYHNLCLSIKSLLWPRNIPHHGSNGVK